MRRHLVGRTYTLRNNGSRARRRRWDYGLFCGGDVVVTVTEQDDLRVGLLVLNDTTQAGFKATRLPLEEVRDPQIWAKVT